MSQFLESTGVKLDHGQKIQKFPSLPVKEAPGQGRKHVIVDGGAACAHAEQSDGSGVPAVVDDVLLNPSAVRNIHHYSGNSIMYRVIHLLVDLGWVDFDLGVPPCCPAAQSILPNSHPPMQNWADSGTLKIKNQPKSVP